MATIPLFEIVTEKPLWLIVFCIILGLLYAFLLYRKERLLEEIKPWLRKLMACFRFITVTLLSFLLLSPLIRSVFREVEKPVVIIAQDHSASLNFGNDTTLAARTKYKDDMMRLADQLSKNYTVKTFSFGEKISEQLDFNFTDKQTDFSQLMDELSIRFSGRNLGAVIIASDGLYNKGGSPVNLPALLRVPFYTIALGDTTVRKDLILSKVNYNRVAFLGNAFPLEVVIDAHQCAGDKTRLSIEKDSVEVFSKSLDISGNRYHVTVPVFLDAKSKGIQHYSLRLSGIAGEINMLNNRYDVFIDVQESRQKILLLAAAPHPDLAALKSTIESTQNYDVEIKQIKDFSGNVRDYNLIILHQLPSVNNAPAGMMDKVMESDVSLFFILGSQTAVRAINDLNTGLKISQSTNKNNEVFADVAADFSLFNVDIDVLKYVSGLPPLVAPFGNYQSGTNVYPLLFQRIGNTKTNQPLLFFSQSSGRKIAVLAGEGLWKWRLKEFSEKNNHAIVDDLLLKSVQYLSVKEKRTPFRVTYKNSYDENEPVVFDAELYNPAGELVNTPEVKLVLTNNAKQAYPFVYSKQGKAYTLNAGYFPVGSYKFKAETKLGNKLFSENGEFIIKPLQLENAVSTADHQLLFAMADNSGGKLFYRQQIDDIAKTIEQREDIKSVSFTQKKLKDLISLKWIFVLAMLLLSAEWFLRKRSGAY